MAAIAGNIFHFGIGGAGNTGALSRTASPSRRSAGAQGADRYIQEAQSQRFSTGVGGRGNIVAAKRAQNVTESSDDATRLLHDAYERDISQSQRRYHTGIGGYANIYQAAVKGADGAEKASDKTRWSNLAARQSSSGENSPRTSMADSMRDIFMGRNGSKSS